MAPHPAEVAAAGPARRPGGQGKARQDGSGGDAGGAQHSAGDSEFPRVWASVQSVLQRHAVAAAKRGHLWRRCPALIPQGGVRPPAHLFKISPPYLRCSDRLEEWRCGALPVVISCSHPSATCPYTAVADTGRKFCGRVAYFFGGPRHIPTSAPATPTAVIHFPGQHAPPGNHHMSGLLGDCPPPQSAST
ncbi:hypothetical protein GWK47_023961 [Chionoecetes opilio]|uniref:Uncharacterized protein n=1 Tax=Chionoecetes opilio TaxID=41210 RepID=A0A8J4XM37_CHIOP|nr:hypothetical protein GWK47_023961 [Chionoecetes opilio]